MLRMVFATTVVRLVLGTFPCQNGPGAQGHSGEELGPIGWWIGKIHDHTVCNPHRSQYMDIDPWDRDLKHSAIFRYRAAWSYIYLSESLRPDRMPEENVKNHMFIYPQVLSASRCHGASEICCAERCALPQTICREFKRMRLITIARSLFTNLNWCGISTSILISYWVWKFVIL